MDVNAQVKYWTTTAAHDWKTVRHLFETRHYPEALFFGHLYLEKLLKALIVQHTQRDAPYGHGLRILAEKAGLVLTAEQILFLTRVTEYNIRGRYPDWMFEFKKRCTRKFCQKELEDIEGFGKWLRKQIKG